ncbi:MAG TPA: MarR family transcriptional regulator [Thermoplasmata archaeon]|nr:MarR family transcriptional regulator [Thermoplasmata archaeon]
MSLHRAGLPFSQFIVLRLLVVRGPSTSRALAQAMGVTTAYLPGLIARLEADGQVSRTRSTQDRREILVAPTRKGRGTLLRLKDAAAEELSKAFDGWTIQELRALLSALQRISGGRKTGDLIQLKVLR